MELDLFRSFVAVAEARSFSRAARAIHLSQSALSRQIGRMEAELGVSLFERYGQHVECTRAGEVLLPLARAVIRRGDDAVALVREQASAKSLARIGATAVVHAHFLAPILASFVTTHQEVTLDIVESDDGLIEEAILRGELDCGVVTAWGQSRAAVRHLLTEEIVLVVPQDHPLATQSRIAWSMLANEPLVLPRSTVNASNVVMDAMRHAGFEPKISYRAAYPELTKALVRRGMGVAPMMGMIVGSLEGLVVIPFAEKLTRQLVLMHSREHQPSPAVKALMRHIVAGAASLPRSWPTPPR
jgi:DNA-binding transcriptional LysR family regulator